MQLYRVKLSKHSKVTDDQNYKGYLGSKHSKMFYTYNKVEADIKAMRYDGTSEHYGRRYSFNVSKILEVQKDELHIEILKAMDNAQRFTDTDKLLEENIYYSSIFNNMYNMIFSDAEAVRIELDILMHMAKQYDYVKLCSI